MCTCTVTFCRKLRIVWANWRLCRCKQHVFTCCLLHSACLLRTSVSVSVSAFHWLFHSFFFSVCFCIFPTFFIVDIPLVSFGTALSYRHFFALKHMATATAYLCVRLLSSTCLHLKIEPSFLDLMFYAVFSFLEHKLNR